MTIKKYNIILKPVEEEDAEFIIKLRTDDKKSRFISKTNDDIELQKEWIRSYKKREAVKEEFYFIAVDNNEEKFATYRIYDIGDDICEIGSWVSKPGYSNVNNSLKVDIIIKEFVFETLGYNQLKFVVNKENMSVLKYHKLFHPNIIGESDHDYYFVLEKENFVKRRNLIFKNIK